MNIWVSSDLHFFHENIIRYCRRPFVDVNCMNQEIVRRWNSLVGADDVAIIVGDVSAGLQRRLDELAAILNNMNGVKILVRGNHDHEPDNFYLSNGFVKVAEHFVFAGVLFCHHPPTDDRRETTASARNDNDRCERYVDRYKPWAIVHGHDHRTDVADRDGCFNCAVERHDYSPVNLQEALRRVNQQAAERYYGYVERSVRSVIGE